jgi:peptide deformylase
VLRHVSKPIKRFDSELREKIREMFDLMYEAEGVGLAANQVDLPLRLFIVNLKADPKKGEELVFLNPVVSRPKGNSEQEEGCLSLPGVRGKVKRPDKVVLNAYTPSGKEFEAELDGLMARVVQHELDHLDGVLFPDRMSDTAKADIAEDIEEFELDFFSRRNSGEIPSDAEIAAEIAEWEKKYCL